MSSEELMFGWIEAGCLFGTFVVIIINCIFIYQSSNKKEKLRFNLFAKQKVKNQNQIEYLLGVQNISNIIIYISKIDLLIEDDNKIDLENLVLLSYSYYDNGNTHKSQQITNYGKIISENLSETIQLNPNGQSFQIKLQVNPSEYKPNTVYIKAEDNMGNKYKSKIFKLENLDTK